MLLPAPQALFRSLLVIVAVAIVGATTVVDAQTGLSDPASSRGDNEAATERIRLATDSGLAALAVWFETTANPLQCTWCDRDQTGRDTLNGLDRAVRDAWVWAPSHRQRAATLSTILEYSLIGGSLVWSALARPGGTAVAVPSVAAPSAVDRWNGVSAVVEALGGSAALTGAIKRAAARERPWAHFQDPTGSGNRNDSFVSGHTSQSFAVATAVGALCHARHCRRETTTWVVGLATASAAGYLRIAADKHYLTDVLAGAGVGVFSGLAVPALGHRVWNAGTTTAVVAPVVLPAGVALRSTWTW